MRHEPIPKIISVRKSCSEAIENTLLENFSNASELSFKERLKINFNKNPDILKSGWYTPPPDGIAVLFSEDNNGVRINYDTLRRAENWPNENETLKDESLALLYFSPIQKKTGLIGDIGLTLYKGKDSKIQKYFQHCLGTMEQIVDEIELGMAFRDVYEKTESISEAHQLKLKPSISSGSAPVGINIGHTFPWSYEEPTKDEINILEKGNQELINSLISKKRLFVHPNENFGITDTGAFTFEPRFESKEDPSMPILYFHFVVTFDNGEKQVLSNFNPLFKAAGMDYLSCKFG